MHYKFTLGTRIEIISISENRSYEIVIKNNTSIDQPSSRTDLQAFISLDIMYFWLESLVLQNYIVLIKY